MVMTDRNMVLGTKHGAITNTYVVLWKSSRHSLIGMSHFTFFNVEFTDDGAWFTKKWSIPRNPYPLIVKMKRTEVPNASTACESAEDWRR